MLFANPYLDETQKASSLQRWLIVHSIVYYVLNKNIVSDKKWDSNAKQLVQLMKDFPEDMKSTAYWYCMSDFDGSTGFDLYDRLNKHDKDKLLHDAKWAVTICK